MHFQRWLYGWPKTSVVPSGLDEPSPAVEEVKLFAATAEEADLDPADVTVTAVTGMSSLQFEATY